MRIALTGRPALLHLVKGAAWSATGEALSRGLMLIALFLVARLLGREQYGELGLLRTTIGTFATLGGFGLGVTANRFVAQYRERDPQFAGQIIGSTYLVAVIIGATVAVLVAIFSEPLAQQMLGHRELANSLRVASLLMFVSALNGAQVGILQGLEAYSKLALANGGQGLCAIIALPVGAAFYGTGGALGGLVLYTIAGAVLFQILIGNELRNRQIAVSYAAFGKALPIFWRFSLPAALMGAAIAPFKWICEAALGREASFGELGLFHAGMLVANVFLALVSTINAPLISLAARSTEDAHSRRTFANLYGTWFLFVALVIPLLIAPSIPGRLLGNAFVGQEFSRVTVLLAAYSGLLLYYQGYVRVIAQSGSMWLALLTNLVEAATLVAAFFMMTPTAAHLAVAYICSYLVRIAVSIPMLTSQKLVSFAMIVDARFLLTFASVAVMVAVQLTILK